MEKMLTRRASQVLFVRRPPRHSTLIRTYSLPVSFDPRRKNSMRRRQAKDATSNTDQRICTKDNCLSCCKKFTAFMFSRVGLFLVMIGYVAFGGLLFRALEAGNEKNMRRSMDRELNTTLYKLWDEVLRVNSFPYNDKKGNFSLYAIHELGQFENTVIRQVQQGFDGRITEDDNDWNYFGAVLYAVTLISTIGYGHITTKTTQGKIATILYSAFGVPLMMLFVANIGSTMAKMFAFVFRRIMMIFCCRMSPKKKRALAQKNRQKLAEKAPFSTKVMIDEKPPLAIKSNLTPIEDTDEPTEKLSSSSNAPKQIQPQSSTSLTNSTTDVRQLPANVRLNMLTGMSTSRSFTSSSGSVVDRSKDAIVRINELIRQDSVQRVDEEDQQQPQRHRRRSAEFSPIEYYTNETKKLTNNLDSPMHSQSLASMEKSGAEGTAVLTPTDEENNMKQVIHPKDTTIIDDEPTTKESKKKILKRSKSESTHNRKAKKQQSGSSTPKEKGETSATPTAKSTRRRFFSRNQSKLKKQATVEYEPSQPHPLHRQMSAMEVSEKHPTPRRKSQSFNQHSTRALPPPPAYETSTNKDIVPLPNTVTWKTEDQFFSSKPTFDLTNLDVENGEGFDDEDDDEDEEMSVPLLVTVFIIPLYLTLGAILFNIWENWGFLNSFYFCFITLTTIGFGDFVPGLALNASAEKEKLISAALYILLGLVLIAMCVNLMKEQLSQKVKRVASKLGSF